MEKDMDYYYLKRCHSLKIPENVTKSPRKRFSCIGIKRKIKFTEQQNTTKQINTVSEIKSNSTAASNEKIDKHRKNATNSEMGIPSKNTAEGDYSDYPTFSSDINEMKQHREIQMECPVEFEIGIKRKIKLAEQHNARKQIKTISETNSNTTGASNEKFDNHNKNATNSEIEICIENSGESDYSDDPTYSPDII